MRKLTITIMMVFIVSLMTASCTKNTATEDQDLYEQGTEGDDGSVKEEREE